MKNTTPAGGASGPGPSPRGYAWLVVGLLWGVALLNYLDRQMLATLQVSMKADIAELARGENFGRLLAVFLWVYALMSPVTGIAADRFNRKWLIVASLAGLVWRDAGDGLRDVLLPALRSARADGRQ